MKYGDTLVPTEWLSGWKDLLPSLMTDFNPRTHGRRGEVTNKLSSDLHIYAMTTHMQTYTLYQNKLKCDF